MTLSSTTVTSTSAEMPNIWERQSRIQASELRLGHYVSSMSIEWEVSPFTMQGVLLTEPNQIRWMQKYCDWIVIDSSRSDVSALVIQKSFKVKPLGMNQNTISRISMKTALKSYVGLQREARDVIASLRSGQFISTDSMKQSVNHMAEQLFDHGPAIVWLTHIKSKDNYTADHCLNVAILAMGLAHSLGWEDKEIHEAGLAGLLHDVGKTTIDSRILNKPGALTEDEFEIMKTHTVNGFDLLWGDPELSMLVKDIAQDHHERPDGLGYPNKLKKDQISDLAALISVVDAYDAITSERCYQKGRNHHLALGLLWKGRNVQFDATMVEAFIAWIGWVSPGTVVTLTTGDKAIVVTANKDNRRQPSIRLITNVNGKPRLSGTKELANILAKDGNKVFIDKVLTAADAKLDYKTLAHQMIFDNVQ